MDSNVRKGQSPLVIRPQPIPQDQQIPELPSQTTSQQISQRTNSIPNDGYRYPQLRTQGSLGSMANINYSQKQMTIPQSSVEIPLSQVRPAQPTNPQPQSAALRPAVQGSPLPQPQKQQPRPQQSPSPPPPSHQQPPPHPPSQQPHHPPPHQQHPPPTHQHQPNHSNSSRPTPPKTPLIHSVSHKAEIQSLQQNIDSLYEHIDELEDRLHRWVEYGKEVIKKYYHCSIDLFDKHHKHLAEDIFRDEEIEGKKNWDQFEPAKRSQQRNTEAAVQAMIKELDRERKALADREQGLAQGYADLQAKRDYHTMKVEEYKRDREAFNRERADLDRAKHEHEQKLIRDKENMSALGQKHIADIEKMNEELSVRTQKEKDEMMQTVQAQRLEIDKIQAQIQAERAKIQIEMDLLQRDRDDLQEKLRDADYTRNKLQDERLTVHEQKLRLEILKESIDREKNDLIVQQRMLNIQKKKLDDERGLLAMQFIALDADKAKVDINKQSLFLAQESLEISAKHFT